MKNYISLIIFTLFTFLTTAQDIDPINGFRGLEWGTTIDNATYSGNDKPIFNLQRTMGKSKVYAIPNDDKTIGAAVVEEIYYYFHEDAGFYKVTFAGNENSNDDIDAILTNRLGNANTELFNTTNVHKIWRIGDVIVDYKEQLSKDFIVVIKSNAIGEYIKKMNQKIDDF